MHIGQFVYGVLPQTMHPFQILQSAIALVTVLEAWGMILWAFADKRTQH